jgi:hypothetical protein
MPAMRSVSVGAAALLMASAVSGAWAVGSLSTAAGTGVVTAASTDDQFWGVSCVDVEHCVAVGSQSAGSLVETWNGSRWLVQNAATAPNGLLTSVSCVRWAMCVAVGYVGVYAGLLAEVWNGATWSIEYPVPRSGTFFRNVACTGPADCVAVGGQPSGTLAEAWNGTTWTLESTPDPPGRGNPYAQLEAVSCARTGVCRAVGQWEGFVASGAVGATLSEVRHGTSWALSPIPNPSGYGGGSLYGVSCPAPTACEAVGTQDVVGDTPSPLAEFWDGTRWAMQGTPYRGDASYTEVNGVSCSAPVACTAVGYYYDSLLGVDDAVALFWDGASWAIKLAADPSHRNTLAGVSCVESDFCLAVGSRYPVSGAPHTLAELWDGHTWTVQATVDP